MCSKYENERADLVGLYYDEASNTLHIEPIEVKTRDESPDATITRDDSDSKSFLKALPMRPSRDLQITARRGEFSCNSPR